MFKLLLLLAFLGMLCEFFVNGAARGNFCNHHIPYSKYIQLQKLTIVSRD